MPPTSSSTGRANAITRGRGKKVGLKRMTSTSSAASSFSKAQKRTYAKMNMKNSVRSAGVRASRMTQGASQGSSGGGIPRFTPQWQLFGGIGDAIKRATGR